VRADRTVFTLSDLPAPDTKRWTIGRKAAVVEAVRGGLITIEDARLRYTLTTEEFNSWLIAIERFGTPGRRCKASADARQQG